ncbi:hypothetical protein [Ancylobacter sp.]|uniref:hypothetical protein n=1 Tax=Ancylobacter sp. TaxID=1872567 RepID=UPI003BAD93D4
MAKPASAYRAARRAEFKAVVSDGRSGGGNGIGSRSLTGLWDVSDLRVGPRAKYWPAQPRPNKYVPHIGKKQRNRRA